MKMEGRFDNENDEDSTATPPESTIDSPYSTAEATEEDYVPSPKRSRRGNHKKVVTVPISDGDGSRSKTEVYPPPDSWTWRKYGQKPIKGSPYPRGYYRCSSSKGCPARKQVERSRHDPTTLLITYNCDHTHPLPTTTTTKNHHHQPNSSVSNSVSISISTTSVSNGVSLSVSTPSVPANFPPEECAVFANQPDIEPATNSFTEIASEFGWLCDVGSTMMDGTTLVAPTWADVKVEGFMPIGEEDKLLFGDLGDLPESSVVFGRCGVETPCCGGTG